MILAIETTALCIVFFLSCFLGTGTDEKNLKSYSSYSEEDQYLISEIAEYRGRYKDHSKASVFFLNCLLFVFLFFILGRFIRDSSFLQNFVSLTIMGQSLNAFDLLVIDLLWWRNTKRIRFTKIPEKELYRNPKKHIWSFIRGVAMYLIIALADGYILTLF